MPSLDFGTKDEEQQLPTNLTTVVATSDKGYVRFRISFSKHSRTM